MLKIVPFSTQPCATISLGVPARVAELEARVSDLEECLRELVPFAACFEVDMQAKFEGKDEGDATIKGWAFKRDTLYLDQRVFRKIAKLMKGR